jgi:tRNA dimethylallyltransferase
LRRFDPAAARRIHPHDVQKLVRAVEICLLTRSSLTAEFAGGRDRLEGYRVLKLGLTPPRAALYERLDQRCRRMFEGGLLDEVRRILLLGFSPSVGPLESHGYKQALQFLRRELTLEQALDQAQRNTRRYAKRQWTWFRREADMQWLEGFGCDAGVCEAVLEQVALHLARGARGTL